jgi:hypothetical protein
VSQYGCLFATSVGQGLRDIGGTPFAALLPGMARPLQLWGPGRGKQKRLWCLVLQVRTNIDQLSPVGFRALSRLQHIRLPRFRACPLVARLPRESTACNPRWSLVCKYGQGSEGATAGCLL